MFLRAVAVLSQSNVRGAATKASKHVNNFKPAKCSTSELANLPPAEHLRSLQRLRAKRGGIKPILNNEPIEPGARVDPTHPAALDTKSFRPPYNSNDYFNARAYPNVMLQRLGVTILPNGRLRPRPPPEQYFPVFKQKKRVKLARAYIMPIKQTHKSAVVRIRLKRKLNEAIQLVVTRGADTDPEGSKIIFKQSEALESKWLLRDWYYIFYPRIPVYHAPWPSLIKAVREALSTIVAKGSELDMAWNLEIAQREAKAMTRLTRREMRRVRMWRRQDQEAVVRGGIAEDVGVRRKQKGMGVKKRRTPREQKKPGFDNRRIKVLRTPSRSAFQEGSLSSPRPGQAVPKSEPVTLEPEFAAVQSESEILRPELAASMRPLEVLQTQRRQGVKLQAGRASRAARPPLAASNSGPNITKPPTLAQPTTSKPPSVKSSTGSRGKIYIKPPSSALVDAIRRKPLSKLSKLDSDPASTNRGSSSPGGQKRDPASSSNGRGSSSV